jgi:hypothetical protein
MGLSNHPVIDVRSLSRVAQTLTNTPPVPAAVKLLN